MRRRDRAAVAVLVRLGQVLGWLACRPMWRGTEPGGRALLAARQLTGAPGTVFDEMHYVHRPEDARSDQAGVRRERPNQWINPDA